MYERFITKAQAKSVLAASYDTLLTTGKVTLTIGVHVSLVRNRHYLVDMFTTDGSNLYPFAPESIKPTIPCRVAAADAGVDLDYKLLADSAAADDQARQARFAARLMAV